MPQLSKVIIYHAQIISKLYVVTLFYFQLRHGQSGDLGAAALKAVAKGNRKDNAHAQAASAARAIELRQDFATENLVLVGFM